ncbi:hypothetical protein BDQ12DRAFT_725360 [Crucibulum laeve]|uniref:Uncharacterized protein n=1 Tax=Crucibulum laeve TaxID=68775 RepID=A0A5C3M4K3_9AGAR|nr:hypothetical protein BDQ12DRAFT_725360 [Crucibulum laeve]
MGLLDNASQYETVSIGGFSPLISYSQPSLWYSGFNDPKVEEMKDHPLGYHRTYSLDTSFSFNFTGTDLSLFGVVGPTFGSVDVQVDSVTTATRVYNNISLLPFAFFSMHNLTNTEHQVTVINRGVKDGEPGGNSFLFYDVGFTYEVSSHIRS